MIKYLKQVKDRLKYLLANESDYVICWVQWTLAVNKTKSIKSILDNIEVVTI